MSKKADKDAEKAAGKKDKKGKKGKGSGAGGPSVAGHPRASYQVRRAKGWGGIAGFALAAYFSYKAGVPTADLGLRALVCHPGRRPPQPEHRRAVAQGAHPHGRKPGPELLGAALGRAARRAAAVSAGVGDR